MNKKIILLFLLLLTGCYDKKELNDIAIITATEINKIDNEFTVNVQVVNPQSPDKTTNVQAPFIMYKGSGRTIHEAYRNIKKQSSRFLYPNHMEILIINEKLAQEDISQIVDFFLRIPDIRTEFNVLIGKKDDILNITSPIDDISATSILNTMETNNKYLGITNLITFNEFANMVINKDLEVILPSITITNQTNDKSEENKEDTKENTESTTINSLYELDTLAIFKDNNLTGYLTKIESITYNVIKNKTKIVLINYECEENKYIAVEATDIKSKINIKDNKINIDINMTGNINENNCNINLTNNKNIKTLQKDLEQYIKKITEESINNIRKEYNTDIFGFLDIIHKTNFDMYKKIKNNWYEEIYQNISVNINPSIKIIGKGNIWEGNNEKN